MCFFGSGIAASLYFICSFVSEKKMAICLLATVVVIMLIVPELAGKTTVYAFCT